MVDDSNQAVVPAPVQNDQQQSNLQADAPGVGAAVPTVTDPTQAVTDPTNATLDPVPATTPAQTQTQDAADETAASDKAEVNPLDVLEKLLDEIDQGKKSPGLKPKSLDSKAADASAGPTPEEELAAEELEKRRIEFEQKQAEQQAIDQKLIEEQRQALAEEMQHGVANVARAQQDAEKKTDMSEKQQAGEGYEVVQLSHKKI